ncbi:phycocyanobilin:ferredoxin oxidoreductase [Acaryochloris marina]|uniref:Phycocyanobilin:ferredoxin oxidoreductase n=1 Tax=Acaryochloris marina (strain MBIC 11017) TaxID=329726 RepID=A8ZMS5_ACAM1|nr:phycocyanobilin:ferredoxin oxidoreductase [Acaryochloris marina]ABW32486.1 phycocyanobilin:ferredoxin oxidoreductase PcyA [Acaryochloris marina MBIC11017]
MSIRHLQHHLIQKLANQIEMIWVKKLDISCYLLPPEFTYLKGIFEDQNLVIENICYKSEHFRKLHIELAHLGNGLDVLHCVMFPKTKYDLPIFGADIISARGKISAAIVDLSPVTSDRTLPKDYCKYLNNLPEVKFSKIRKLPDWGDIFSEYCLFIQPQNTEEENHFLNRVTLYLSWHCEKALLSQIVEPSEISNIHEGHAHYCQQQKLNDKTRRILEKAFGKEWANTYMDRVLFDF